MMKKLFIITFIVSGFVFSACEQQEGERCETNSDCSSDLICCIPTGEQEGTCQYEENCQIQKKKLIDSSPDSCID